MTALRQEAAASPRSRTDQSTALQKEQQSRVQGPLSLVGGAGHWDYILKVMRPFIPNFSGYHGCI